MRSRCTGVPEIGLLVAAFGFSSSGCEGRQGNSVHAVAPANSTQPATQAANPTPEVEPHLLADAPVTEPPMKVAFDAETVDAGWGPSFEVLIGQAMEPFSASALVSAECKTTICKIVAKHDTPIDGAKWAQHFPLGLAKLVPQQPVTWAATHVLAPDMLNSTLYLTRPGYLEPNPDGSPRQAPERRK